MSITLAALAGDGQSSTTFWLSLGECPSAASAAGSQRDGRSGGVRRSIGGIPGGERSKDSCKTAPAHLTTDAATSSVAANPTYEGTGGLVWRSPLVMASEQF